MTQLCTCSDTVVYGHTWHERSETVTTTSKVVLLTDITCLRTYNLKGRNINTNKKKCNLDALVHAIESIKECYVRLPAVLFLNFRGTGSFNRNFRSKKNKKTKNLTVDNKFRTELASTDTIRRGKVTCNLLKIMFHITYI